MRPGWKSLFCFGQSARGTAHFIAFAATARDSKTMVRNYGFAALFNIEHLLLVALGGCMGLAGRRAGGAAAHPNGDEAWGRIVKT